MSVCLRYIFFFQAEDGIRDIGVTGVQTCALPIFAEVIEAFGALAERPGTRDRRPPVQLRGRISGRLRFAGALKAGVDEVGRSEERRVGKECRSRWSPYH